MGGGPQLLNPLEDNEYDITEDKNQGYLPNAEDTAQDTIEHPVDMLPSVDSTGNQNMSKDLRRTTLGEEVQRDTGGYQDNINIPDRSTGVVGDNVRRRNTIHMANFP